MALLRSDSVRGLDVDDTPIFREVAEAWAAGRYPVRAASPTAGRHHWMHTQLPAEEAPMGRHTDADGDGQADHAEHVEAEALRWESEQGWCEDRNPDLGELTDHDEIE